MSSQNMGRSAFVKIAVIACLIFLTNQGLFARSEMLFHAERFGTLIPYLGLWGLALLSVLVIAFLPNTPLRIFWAALVAISTFAGRSYQTVSGADLSVFDIASMINVANEAGRAAKEFGGDLILVAVLTLLLFAALIWRVPLMSRLNKKVMVTLSITPILLISAITYVIHHKQGGGNKGLPNQFSPIAATVAYSQVSLKRQPVEREQLVDIPNQTPMSRHVVLLVDESVSSEHLDPQIGNQLTPNYAKAVHLMGADFGRAVSGSNCSHYANAILRLGGSRKQLAASVQQNPTIWSFAKQAGYRTIYVDAQYAGYKDSKKLQNFMTPLEAELIDEYISFPDTEARHLDMKLANLLAERLNDSKEPLFVYANKNGAHFPYDDSYPSDQNHYRPTMSDSGPESEALKLTNSYKNAIRWSVDEFFNRLMAQNSLDNTLMFYTSDHGQYLHPERMSHCSTTDAHPLEATVPLVVFSGDPDVRIRFREAAQANFDRASHFSIFPTLLSAFGYSHMTIASRFEDHLFSPNLEYSEFTSGDIFGLFRTEPTWNSAKL